MVFSYLLDKYRRAREKRPVITHGEIEEAFDIACRHAGKTEAILSQGNINMAIFRASKMKSIFGQATVAMHEIAVSHPFSDGNKRTAILTAELILYKRGYKLKVENPEQTVKLIKKVADKKKDINEIKEWVEKHSVKL